MEIKIYVDSLFLTNFVIDCALLVLSAKITKAIIHKRRLFLAAAYGGIYSVFAFFISPPIYVDGFLKILSGGIMVFIAFKPHNIISLVRHICIFLAITFCAGGIAMALFYHSNAGAAVGAVLSGGTFYINLPIYKLIFAFAFCYILLSLFNAGIKKYKKRSEIIYSVTLYHNGKKAVFNALYDSGNSLCDAKSGLKVMVVNKSSILKILKSENINIFNIPYKSIAGSGKINVFIPDKVIINKKEIMVCVGIADEGFCDGFDAILPVNFDEGNE